MTIEQRRVTYTIPANEVNDFVENIKHQFGKVPDNILNPQPFPNRRVFISYRRDDSADVTGRIYDYLSNHFGKNSIFLDTENIPLGIDFRTELKKAIESCDVALVIIGKNWINRANRARLYNKKEEDFVRFEIETALRRNIPIIPILVQGREKFPNKNYLPKLIKPLAYRNGIPVRSKQDFYSDMKKLIEWLEVIFMTIP